ncbi:MAG TPA: hypothetical protein PLU55_05080 [Candidatus Pacearchaeota archaeon]|jgi:hypothetical protein|nr:hypothetical protein [Candidatus Pacearchaeota archaeon]
MKTRKNDSKYSISLYNDKLKQLIIAISKKKNTTTTKYIEEALQIQVEKDKNLLEKEELFRIVMK